MGCCSNKQTIDFYKFKTTQEIIDNIVVQINRFNVIINKYIQESNTTNHFNTNDSFLDNDNQINKSKNEIVVNHTENQKISEFEYSFYIRLKLACVRIKYTIESKIIQNQIIGNTDITGINVHRVDKNIDYNVFKEILNELFDCEDTKDLGILEELEKKVDIKLNSIIQI